jgi:ABC-2 type transport system permease protein
MKIGDLIKKDMQLVLSDPKAMVFIILMPMVLILILSFSLGAAFEGESIKLDIINVAVVDENPISERLPLIALNATLYDVLDSEGVKEIVSYEALEKERAEEMLDNGEISAVIIVPLGFYEDVMSNFANESKAIQIEVLSNLNSSFEANIVSSIVSAYTREVSSVISDNRIISNYLSSDKFLDFMDALNQERESRALDAKLQGVGERKPINQFYYYSIAITCMFILYTAGQGSAFLLEERNNKTLARLVAAGVTKNKLLLAKCAAIFALCVIQLFVLFVFSTLAFNLKWGNMFIFLAIALSLSFSVTGIGALLMILSYKTGSRNYGDMFMAIGAQLLALIGGSFIPLSVLPKFFSVAALFTPNGLAILAFTGNVQGAPLGEMAQYMAGNILIGILTLAAGIIWFKKRGRENV